MHSTCSHSAVCLEDSSKCNWLHSHCCSEAAKLSTSHAPYIENAVLSVSDKNVTLEVAIFHMVEKNISLLPATFVSGSLSCYSKCERAALESPEGCSNVESQAHPASWTRISTLTRHPGEALDIRNQEPDHLPPGGALTHPVHWEEPTWVRVLCKEDKVHTQLSAAAACAVTKLDSPNCPHTIHPYQGTCSAGKAASPQTC